VKKKKKVKREFFFNIQVEKKEGKMVVAS